MKNNSKTAAALVELLKANGIEAKTTHTSPAIKRHLILLTSKADMEKALTVARDNGFADVKEVKGGEKISVLNPAFKAQPKKAPKKAASPKKAAKKAAVKSAPKKAAEKSAAKPATKKTAAKFKGKVGPKKKIPAMFIEGKVILALFEGVTIYNFELILIAFLKKKDPGVRKSILKKVVQATGVQIEGGLTASIQKKLEKLERIEKAVVGRKK